MYIVAIYVICGNKSDWDIKIDGNTMQYSNT